jgi:myosin-5
MEDLIHQNPAAVLYNLKQRHFLQKTYTRVGDILIAMNPFVWIDDLYSSKTQDLYSKHLIWNGMFYHLLQYYLWFSGGYPYVI